MEVDFSVLPLLEKINRSQLTVVELKDELRARGAKLTGNKADLEDRLRFILTTGRVIPGQTGKSSGRIQPQGAISPGLISPVALPVASPVVLPPAKKLPLAKLSLTPEKYPSPKVNLSLIPKVNLPSVPKVVPKFQEKLQPIVIGNIPKISPSQPAAPALPPKISPKVAGPSPTLTSLIDLKYNVVKDLLKLDQLKKELEALGISTVGNKAQLNATLKNYLNAVDLTANTENPPIQFNKLSGSPQNIFNIYNAQTNETIMQNIQPGMFVTVQDRKKNTFHTFRVINVKRSPFGLVQEIVLDPRGYSLIRYQNQWKLFNNPQAGQLGQATTYDVAIAAGLQII